MPPLAIAAVGAAATIGGAYLGGQAQKKAAKSANKAAQQTAAANNALTEKTYNSNKAMLSPFVNSGVAAGNSINALLAKGPYNGGTINSTFLNSAMNPGSLSDFKASTGYQHRLAEGLEGIETFMGAKGAYQSGAAIQEAGRFNQNLASNEYQNYINQVDRYGSYADAHAANERAYQTDQYGNYINMLGNQQGVGLAGASALAGVGQNYVNTVSANNNSAGTAAANAALMKGQSNSQMYAGIGNAIGQFAGSSYGGLPGGGFSLPPLITPYGH